MDIKDVLTKNTYLKGIGNGGRCFILGNGPSLNRQNLKMLKNEAVIAVSHFYKHPDAKEINPDYWLLADPLFWQKPEIYLFPILAGLKEKLIFTKLFNLIEAAPLYSKIHYGINIEPHFFWFDYSLKHMPEIDFSRGLPPFGQTVIITAIMLAFFLGFKDIYLLGCDHDFLAYTKENYDSMVKEQHFYPSSIPTAETYDYASEAKAVERVKFQYSVLKHYAADKGIRLYNATDGGYLDLLPRIKYEHLFAASMYSLPKPSP